MRVRAKLTLSYAGFLLAAGALLLAVVWVFLLRYVPPDAAMTTGGFMPGRNDLIRAFFPKAAWALVFLLVFGLGGGWLLAGRMLAPLARITRATRKVAAGSLSHRIELAGNHDEFRELADSFDSMLGRLAEQRGLSLQAGGAEARVTGSPVLLQQLVVNLVHNAIVHNRPADGWVRLLTGRDGQQAFLTVENSGDMLTETAVATFTASFQRHTARVRSDQAGVGLGLTIAESITKAHGGSLSLVPPAGWWSDSHADPAAGEWPLRR